MKRELGQGLIGVIVGIGVAGIVATSMMSMIHSQHRETVFLEQKLAALEFEKNLIQLLSNDQMCSEIVAPSAPSGTSLLVNLTNLLTGVVPKVVLKTITSVSGSLAEVGKPLSPSNPNMIVENIELVDIKDAGQPDRLFATMRVSFDSSRLIRALRPVESRLILTTEPTSPLGGKRIIGCAAAAPTGSLSPQQICEQMLGYSWVPAGVPPCVITNLNLVQKKALCGAVKGVLNEAASTCTIMITGILSTNPMPCTIPMASNLGRSVWALAVLRDTSEFIGAEAFRHRVSILLSNFNGLNERQALNEIYSLAGVDSRDHSQIATFLTADDSTPFVQNAMRLSSLNEDQARKLVSTLSRTLRGEVL